MKTLVNSKESSQISAHDRGLLYGQSVFETIAIRDGVPCLLEQHLARMQLGCSVLGIPFDEAPLRDDISALASNQAKAVIRASLTMGEGGRGYLNPISPSASRVIALHDYPKHDTHYWERGINLGLVDVRLSNQPLLAGIKHGNRLEQIVARNQWQASWQEALLMDQAGNVIEATQSNIFVIKEGQLITPELNLCGVNGVIREYLLKASHKLGLSSQTVSLSVADIEAADEVFVCNSVIGLWPINSFKSRSYSTFKISHKILKYMLKNEVIPNY